MSSILPELQKRMSDLRTRLQSRLSQIRTRVPMFARAGYNAHTPGATGIFGDIQTRVQNVLKSVEPLRPLNVAKRIAERAGLKVQIPSPPPILKGAPSETKAVYGEGIGMKTKRKVVGL